MAQQTCKMVTKLKGSRGGVGGLHRHSVWSKFHIGGLHGMKQRVSALIMRHGASADGLRIGWNAIQQHGAEGLGLPDM